MWITLSLENRPALPERPEPRTRTRAAKGAFLIPPRHARRRKNTGAPHSRTRTFAAFFQESGLDMHLAFFAQCGYASPVLKMFQGGSREAVFSFGKKLPLSSFPKIPNRTGPGKGKPFHERPPFPSFSPQPSYRTRNRHRRKGATPGRHPQPGHPFRRTASVFNTRKTRSVSGKREGGAPPSRTAG